MKGFFEYQRQMFTHNNNMGCMSPYFDIYGVHYVETSEHDTNYLLKPHIYDG